MKKVICCILIFCLCSCLGGCFLDPAENLYVVPKQAESFYHLQKALEGVMSASASYSPPVSGENQQPIQTADLDGDKEDEAVVFLKTGNSMCLCVFDKNGDSYSLLAKLEGSGNAFDQVQYVQFDGRPGNEIVVGRRISDGVTQVLSVLTLHDGALVELISTSYHEYITADLNSDGLRDVLLLYQDGDVQNGTAVYYHWADGQPVREIEANMSAPVSSIKRIITGKMCDGVPAVFVASAFGEGKIVTDIFGLRDNAFANLTLSEDTDTGVQTVREYYVYSCDIDSDGLIELPRLIPMKSLPDDESSNNQSLIYWYNVQLDRHENYKCLTYHNYSDGWYLTIAEEWTQKLAVRSFTAFGTTRGYSFVDAESGKSIFSISAVGSDSAAGARQGGWVELMKKGEITYVCSLEEAADNYGLTITKIKEMFHLIRIDWNTGET